MASGRLFCVGYGTRVGSDRRVQAHHRRSRRPLSQSVSDDSKDPHAHPLLDRPTVVCQGTLTLRKLVDHSVHNGHARVLSLDRPKAKIGEPARLADFSLLVITHARRVFCHLPDHAARSLLALAILSKPLIFTALAQRDLPVLFVCLPSNVSET